MKRSNKEMTFLGAFLFFISISVTAFLVILFYRLITAKYAENELAVTLFMLVVIVFLAIVWVFADLIRRRIMINEPVEKILSATERLSKGDFSVRLNPRHPYGKYDEFDVIMANINLMAAELGKSEILKNDFISNVSHEIKTPVAVIVSYAKLLKSANLREEEREKYSQTLYDAAHRLDGLVSGILQLNRLENRKLSTEKNPVYLHDLLAEIILRFEDVIEKKNINLNIDLDEVIINSSTGYIDIIFNNLISNAIKFTEDDGKVSVSLKEKDGQAIVSVSDTGCGISHETGKHIFDKFYQGDTSHAKEGNGLGLALVKKVIDVLGGTISVKSEVGKGSTFTVTIKKSGV